MKALQDKPTKKQIDQWWKEFRKSGDDDARNGLLENYLPLVRATAERLHAKLPDEVDVDDLASAGVFGLIDTLNAFDPERGVKFETYCTSRIRGAMLDHLRSLDWVPRLVRSRAHKLNDALQSLETRLGRNPTEKELAAEMNLSMGQFRKLRKDAQAVGLISLDKKWTDADSNKDLREIDILEDRRSDNPYTAAQKRDLKELVSRGLSRAERLIIMLYYFEEMTMKEIGETLDLSESRVSQMHSAVLMRLKDQLESRKKELQAG